MSLKFTEELCITTMTNDAKFKEELTCRFKTDTGNLPNLAWSVKSLKKIAFQLAVFYQSIKCLSVKSTEKLSFMTLKTDAKFEKKNWLVVWKMLRGIWQIFTRVLESLKIETLTRFFCPKLKMYELKIYKGVILS